MVVYGVLEAGFDQPFTLIRKHKVRTEMKKKSLSEPLLNVIARQVGRAAGTVARVTNLVAPEDTPAAQPPASRKRKKSKPASATRSSATKKNAGKSRARKPRSKTSRPSRKTT
jgi:hypothetical protein